MVEVAVKTSWRTARAAKQLVHYTIQVSFAWKEQIHRPP